MSSVTHIVEAHIKPAPNQTPLWLGKLLNYEYWPIWLFYIPLVPYICYLGLKARSFAFFTAANPGMKDGGSMWYSKSSILAKVPNDFTPKAVVVPNGEDFDKFDLFSFPIIAKPDMGERGKGVTLVHSQTELDAYLASSDQDVILQEYIDYPIELGVFYVRRPSEQKGMITSVTAKEFLTVTGDGVSDIRSLMSMSFRARLQMYRQTDKFLHTIPDQGEVVDIEVIGNHNRGTKFINAYHLITPELEAVFDTIAMKIDGFYYGRFDLKCKSIPALLQGKYIKIVEVNGVNSEPTHIYDQSNGIWKAYQDFYKQIWWMYVVSKENMDRGVKPSPAWSFWKSILFP